MQGIAVSKGIGIARPFIYNQQEIIINDIEVAQEEIVYEEEKIDSAYLEAELQLNALKEKALNEIGEEEAEIFEAHLMMLKDPMLAERIKESIDQGKKAEVAVEAARQNIEKMFMAIPDPYIQGRAADINDVTRRLIQILLGIDHQSLADINEPVILIAKDLTPSDTVGLSKQVKGIITEIGSETSHAAIIAKAMGLPAMVGVKNAVQAVDNAEVIILDTVDSNIIMDPSESLLKNYHDRLEVLERERDALKALKFEKAMTTDGHVIKLYANIGSTNELPYMIENGAEGIGLLRTELIYMNSDHFPTEEEQFNIYKEVAENGGNEIIIRTLDIGGDKQLSYYDFQEEMNPFLGFRAIRLCLGKEEIFKTQLKAILRAAIYGNIKIMFPMITSMEELRQVKLILEQCKKELKTTEVAYKEDISVGIMIEVPAAVMIADMLIEEVDFFSIGTNDLCQYSLAVDRMNTNVAHLYQPLHPGVLRMIKKVIKDAHDHEKMVGMCGEMAGNPDFTPVLVGLGLDELSMSPSSIPVVKKIIRQLDYKKTRDLAKQLTNYNTVSDIQKRLEEEALKC
ncbi:phosphoenolpyruvate--protein phosphotransferase [Vallitalea okinawensis]|uniref:phosphoenolpyruvate--protein phosphotransferase n=1 Tax=Vallitalea okinawensis TaxID=2078660 RepID=UPI000CFAF24A|nr:phosphoenolpyruvate--protein phosphotransferase [Vallitalea okinawensis]